MKSRFLLFILPVLLLLTFWLWPRQEKISYNRQIRPIINNKCISCHGGVKQSGGFSLLFEEEAKMDTESGKPAIIPGDAEASEMVTRLTHHDPELRMPLGKDPLSNEEINLIKEWINQGANWEKHWAYIPPAKDIEVPTVDMEIPAQNEIDHFIFRQLAKMELSPNEEAPKELLLRRLTLDITGLPPDIQAYDDFIADTSPNAYENKVDQLLASPHFGEKWAAFWMDLARYSDSKGYEKDLHREIWKYRDWLIEAFNQDMPFDQFTIAQLAGDLMPDPTESDLLATAFHRNTMANDEGGTNDEEFRVAAVMERVGTTFEVWQGTTMACVQCHSHPYDPIRHEEFYKSQAFFNNTQDKDLYNEQPKVFTYEKEDEQKVKELLSWVNENLRPSEKLPKITDRFLHKQKQELLYSLGFRKVEAEEFQDKSRFIELVAHDQESIWQVQDSSWIMFENVDLTDISAISLGYASLYGAKVEIRLDSVLGEKIGEGTFRITDKNFPGNRPTDWETLKVSIKPVSGTRDIFYYFKKDQTFAQDLIRVDWVFYHEKAPLKDKYPPSLQAKLEELSNTKAIETPILKDLPKSRSRKTHVFERGDWRSKGEEVRANTPEIMGTINKDNPTRLDFAKWLVNGENSLTSRVIVNRIWEQIFGFGIVESMEDFGSQGIPASHPELLDWLAVNFQDDMNWSMKKLIKKIVMSQSYSPSREVCTSRRIRTNTPLQSLVLLNDPVYIEAADAWAKRILKESGNNIKNGIEKNLRLVTAKVPEPEKVEVLHQLYLESLSYYQKEGKELDKNAELAAMRMVSNAMLNLDEFVTRR